MPYEFPVAIDIIYQIIKSSDIDCQGKWSAEPGFITGSHSLVIAVYKIQDESTPAVLFKINIFYFVDI